jgi:hypothetical protein
MIGPNMKSFLVLAAIAQLLPAVQQARADDAQGSSKSDVKKKNDEKNDYQKNKKNKVVVFKDGSCIEKKEIIEELCNLPPQATSRMTYDDIMMLLTLKAAYTKVIFLVAEESKIGEKPDVKAAIAQKQMTMAGILLQNKKAKELMTFKALQSHHGKSWEEKVKGTKDLNLTAIVTNDKNKIKEAKKSIHDDKSLEKYLKSNPSVRSSAIGSRHQSMFPPEVVSEILKGGKNTVVGPFAVNGTQMLLYVNDITDAKKQEFTEEFAERYEAIARKDFVDKYMMSLHEKYGIEVFDVNGSKVDAFAIASRKKGDDDKKKKREKRPLDISKIKDDFVVARFKDGRTVTVKDLKKFFKVDSLLDDSFIAMAQQFSLTLEEVIVYAAKLLVDDIALACEVKEEKSDEDPETKKILDEIKRMEIITAYFDTIIAVKNEDVVKTFERTIKSIPDDVKNDNEISVKMLFFATSEDAAVTLREIHDGHAKFNELFKEGAAVADKSAVDLGYLRKNGSPPEFWEKVKGAPPGTCVKEIIQTDGSQYGMNGKNYAIIYVADKRPVTLPSLSNPADKKHFQVAAKVEKMTELAEKKLKEHVETINGRPVEVVLEDPKALQIVGTLVGQNRSA